MKPLTEKYRPSSTSAIQGHDKAVEQVLSFVKSFPKTKKRAVLLHGPPGSGKTSLAVAVASELGLELVEVNASDVRNAKSIESLLGASMGQQSLFFKGKLILFDEVDGLSGNKDRGGVSALLKLLKTSAYPVILTANDPWSKKLSSLRKAVELVELGSLKYTSVLSVLRKVCEAENIPFEEAALKSLARRCGGDLRGALTDLQTLQPYNEISAKTVDYLDDRRRAQSLFNAVHLIMKTTDASIARSALHDVDENLDEVALWMDENVPREYTKPNDLVRGFDAVSRADVFKGRIMRWQHWRFLVYISDLLTAGVALAKDEKYPAFTKYQRTTRILKLWRASMSNKKRDAIAAKFAQATHCSVKVARQQLPFFSCLLKKDPLHPLVDSLDLDAEEVSWLAAR